MVAHFFAVHETYASRGDVVGFRQRLYLLLLQRKHGGSAQAPSPGVSCAPRDDGTSEHVNVFRPYYEYELTASTSTSCIFFYLFMKMEWGCRNQKMTSIKVKKKTREKSVSPCGRQWIVERRTTSRMLTHLIEMPPRARYFLPRLNQPCV